MSGPQHTQFAMKALDLADLFRTIVGSTPVPGMDGGAFKVELSAPDGPSTGGGKQSVQHIKLVRDGLVIVAGSCDQIERTAELRSHTYVSNLHAQRYRNAPLPIDRAAYDAFLKRAREFLAGQDLSIVLKDAAPVAAPKAASGSSTLLFVGIAVIVALAVAVAYFLVMKK